jgi:hypothetical protein
VGEILRSFQIMLNLLVVDISVYFNDQFVLRTVEIDNESPDGMLTAKFEVAELSVF